MAYTDHANGAFLTRPGNYNVGKQLLDEVVTLSRYFDTTVDALASGAFYKIWGVPDDFTVLDAYVVCDVVEGAVETCDVVDDDSATTILVTNADLSTAGGTLTVTNARKTYQAAGFICLRPDAALTVCKFWVIIKGIILSKKM